MCTLVINKQFPLYERLKAAARNRRRRITGDITAKESPLELVAASACSKLASSCITYPHEVNNVMIAQQYRSFCCSQ
jgi:23S rRNA pseudoU1915 N3-methylase RlmH